MKRLFIILLSLIILLTACKKSDNPVEPTPPNDTSGNIKTGTTVDIITQPISTGGGTIKITKPGDPLNGFELTVPPNSFTQSQTINVSYSPIISHQLGDNFNPISPLIKIKYDGGYANSIMKLKIPIKLPAGHFAMGFFYDETTGKLEGLPLEDLTDDFATVSTRHFSSKTKLAKGFLVKDEISEASLIITSILESRLAGHPVIATGFDPGFDDWEFPNWGSYISPGGHCAGQSITAIWYYYEKRLRGEKDLFHGYDKIHDKSLPPQFLWYDNPRGIRFASIIQEELDWTKWMGKLDIQIRKPKNTFYTIINAMLKTGEPQLIVIRRTTPDTAGHAVIVYKIDPIQKKMYVADPNFPGNRPYDETRLDVRVIEFDGTKFLPYQTMNKVGNPISSYDQIGYFGKTAFIDWSKIKNKWTEFENGTIGWDKFPSYSLYDKTTGLILTNGMSFSRDTLKIVCSSTWSDGGLSGTINQPIEVYDTSGVYLSQGNESNKGVAVIKLNPGLNKFGVYVQGMKRTPAGFNAQYVDFKWVNIIYNEIQIKINPDPLNGQTNTEYTWSAGLTGTPPSNVKYVWNFGDGTGDVTVQNSTTVKHTFSKEGIFDVKCFMYNNTNNTLIASATSKANILSAFLMDVLASKSSTVNILADFKSSSASIGVGNNFTLGNSTARTRINNKIVWNGLSFTSNYVYKIAPYTADSLVVTGSVSGTVSADGKTILTYSASERQELKSGTGSWIERRIDVKDLPFYQTTSISNVYRNTGPSVASNVALLSIKQWTQNPSTQQYELVTLSSVNYNSTSSVPALYILMEK